ncbi:MAG: hypothetical protein OMM_07726 [Candidatus Magnetoglobus multicellularis str. Araruama]|uniref:DUF1848 domain-containing protein n=1 Tax=Candidatus Magnetoglobus multicellularis str. Araruama TaxID=890399 RepID=A0A1V1PBD8_9BACT|nr:MAG: hypothetical protein OMM_07726 [Candidatus Magnetoglobus multicellularis str. Araruama]
MQKNNQIVISASRRTDIPAFHMDWFMSGLTQGYFSIHHPYHRKKIIVTANSEKIHTMDADVDVCIAMVDHALEWR